MVKKEQGQGQKNGRGAFPALLASIGLVAVMIAACAPGGSVDEATVEGAEEVTADEGSVNIDAQQWMDEYPLEYGSWADSIHTGTNGLQTNEKYNWDEKMGKPAAMMAAVKSDLGVGSACIGCHSSSFVTMYDEYGGDLVTLSEDELIHESGLTGITCYTCHGNQPGQMFVSKVYIAEAAETGMIETAEGNLVCAQCHALPNRAWTEELGSTDEDRSMGIMGNTDTTTWSTLSAGANADDVYQWFLGQGNKDPKIVIGEMEFEQYYGSTMEQAGVTCSTCHMEQATAEDGAVYTRHAWQGANVNEAIYENCKQCHDGDMQAEVLERQAAYQEELAEVTAALDSAREAIEASDSDEATIAEATDLWFEARFHSRYGQDSSEGIHGIGNANTDYCFDKCKELCAQIEDMV